MTCGHANEVPKHTPILLRYLTPLSCYVIALPKVNCRTLAPAPITHHVDSARVATRLDEVVQQRVFNCVVVTRDERSLPRAAITVGDGRGGKM